jgi:hypothetical protein
VKADGSIEAAPTSTPATQPNPGQGQPGQQGQDATPAWYRPDTGGTQPQQAADGEGEGEGESGAPAEYVFDDDVKTFEVKTEAGAVRIDANDPRLPDAKAAARELGLSQAEFNKVLKLDAKLTAAAVARANKQIDDAVAAMGPTFQEERRAVVTWAQSHLSPAEARELDLWLSYGDLPTRFRLVQRLSGLSPGAMHNSATSASPQPKSVADRIWPSGFVAKPQARAR